MSKHEYLGLRCRLADSAGSRALLASAAVPLFRFAIALHGPLRAARSAQRGRIVTLRADADRLKTSPAAKPPTRPVILSQYAGRSAVAHCLGSERAVGR